ncbi:probable N-acetylgalactosaminyltransferase 9 [Amphibalanus amphitrite]|uniref:probable N-acetylgalactosaminyltransferase 9 n=1 Tax=Amphibalanus amphitrite TaxID=1232801 RepID=UPI001C90D758|nr:probable N-acetylgalactosaminyltransferase 9 [Amphibalanus amphitrite]
MAGKQKQTARRSRSNINNSQSAGTSRLSCRSLAVHAVGAVAVAVAVALLCPSLWEPAGDRAGPAAVTQQDPAAGDLGRPVALTAEERRLADQLYKQEGFNVVASDKVPFVRRLPDVRPQLCRGRTYDTDLPAASIIINFHNEVWSALLRSVHSVLARTPAHLLYEILLIDDASTKPELGEPLERYVSDHLPSKVTLHRLKERHGLIRGRHWGAQQASGPVLIFLDSHVEPCDTWIEPLLQRIKDEPHALVCPVIDNIRDTDLAYQPAERVAGGFTWSGHFAWIEAGGADGKLPSDEAAPVRSPVMSGGLYAISREYFWHLGGYDTGMDVYGGENLELSFRTWQCGGVVETLPCSRVGHIFRDFHPYSFPFSGNPLAANMARIAAVWMDEYSRYFYLHYRHTEMPEAGDVTARRELREQLQCHSFRWYLDNVYPNKMRLDEDVLASGQVRSALRPDLCIDTLVIDRQIFLGLNSCTQPVVSGQYLTLSKRGELRREDNCAYAGGAGPHAGTVMAPMAPCTIKGSEQQQWIYDGQTAHLRHMATGLCLNSSGVEAMHLLYLATCTADVGQRFTFENGQL